jgi:hypothetical protein
VVLALAAKYSIDLRKDSHAKTAICKEIPAYLLNKVDTLIF